MTTASSCVNADVRAKIELAAVRKNENFLPVASGKAHKHLNIQRQIAQIN